MIWKVLNVSGIIGIWNCGRLFVIGVIFLMCGILRLKMIMMIVVIVMFVKGVGMILVILGMK